MVRINEFEMSRKESRFIWMNMISHLTYSFFPRVNDFKKRALFRGRFDCARDLKFH